MKQFGVVFRFEFLEHIKNKSFRIISIVGSVLIVIAFCIPLIMNLFSGSSGNSSDLPALLVSSVDQADQAMYSAAFGNIANVSFTNDSEDALRSAVESQQARGALVVHSNDNFTFMDSSSLTQSDWSYQIQQACNQIAASAQMQRQGVSADDSIEILHTKAQIQIDNVGGFNNIVGFALGYIMLILLFMAIMLYGQTISMSVASEKSTRAMEVLITYTEPKSLIFGKVFAACAAGIMQLLLFLAVGVLMFLVSNQFFYNLDFLQPILSQASGLIGSLILFFLFGFLSFAFLFGAVGSLVSRIEDMNSASTPVILLALIVYFVGFYTMSDPNGTVMTVCSCLPFFSPILMYLRICMTDVPLWQIGLSVLVNLLTILFTGWVGTAIYRIGILSYGTKLKLSEVFQKLKQR